MELAGRFDLVELGKVWFKWRGFAPVPLLVVALFVGPTWAPGPGATALLFLLILGGELLRVWAVGHAGSATRTRGETVNEFVCAGPFRFVRNPLYVGNIVIYLSWSLLLGMGYFTIAFAAYFALEYVSIVRFEETLLLRTFGDRYRAYTESVGRWIPRLTPSPIDTGHAFDLRAALRSERSTFLAHALMALLFVAKRVI